MTGTLLSTKASLPKPISVEFGGRVEFPESLSGRTRFESCREADTLSLVCRYTPGPL